MSSLISNIRYNSYYQRAMVAYQKPEIKASLELILSVIVVAVLLLIAIRPTLANIASLQKKIEDVDSVIIKADNKITQLTRAQEVLATNTSMRDLLNVAVGDDLMYSLLSKRLEILALENNLKIESIKLPGRAVTGDTTRMSAQTRDKTKGSLTVTPGGLTQIEIAMSVSGSQKSVFDFAQAVENMDRIVRVESMAVSKSVSNIVEAQTDLKAEIKMVAYTVIKPQ
jgi:hypothetical protein